MIKDFILIAVLLCITNTKAQQLVSPCTSTNTQHCGILGDCTKFYMCIKGRPYIAQCRAGALYSAQAGDCIQATQCPQQTTNTCVTVPSATTAATTTPTTPATTTTSTTTTTTRTTPTTTSTSAGSTTPSPKPPCTSSTIDQVCGIPNDCSKFVLCSGGYPFIVQCATGNYYSQTDKKCVHATQCPQTAISSTCTSLLPETTTPTTAATTPSTTRSTVTTTPTTTTTRTTTTTTKAPTTTTTTTTTQRPPVIIPPCTSLQSETYEIANDCTRFLACVDGAPSVVRCRTGEFFNATSGKCVKAAQCPQGATTPTPTTTTTPKPTTTTTPKPTTTTTTTAKPTTTTTTTPRPTTTTTAKPVTCAPSGSSTHPFPGDQGKYYYCMNGVLYVVQCPTGTAYSAQQNGCVA